MGLAHTRIEAGDPQGSSEDSKRAGRLFPGGDRGRPGLRARRTPLGTDGGSDPRAEAYLGSGLRLLSAPAIPEQETHRKGVGTRKE